MACDRELGVAKLGLAKLGLANMIIREALRPMPSVSSLLDGGPGEVN